jgi:hypothetical protein
MLPILLTLALAGQPTTASALDAIERTAVRVVMVLVPAETLPAPPAIVRREVQRIWQTAGLDIQWRDRATADERRADRVIAVHLTDDAVDGVRLPAGALGGVPTVNGQMRPMIFVSPSAVERLVSTGGATRDSSAFALLYSRMVGRVVAHELGHLLLHSSEHRSSGLMRAMFVGRDVVSTDARRFALAEADVALVHDRIADAAATTTATVAAAVDPPLAASDGSRRRR